MINRRHTKKKKMINRKHKIDDKQKKHKIGGNQSKQVRNHRKYKLIKFTYGKKIFRTVKKPSSFLFSGHTPKTKLYIKVEIGKYPPKVITIER